MADNLTDIDRDIYRKPQKVVYIPEKDAVGHIFDYLKEARIPLRDKIEMGPIDKYRYYNRFPWKMMV